MFLHININLHHSISTDGMLEPMVQDDGRGFIEDADEKYWGIYGAAGVLLRTSDPITGKPLILLQHRGLMGHFGGTWALPGGARDSHETPVQAALRELYEESSITAEQITITDEKITFTSPTGWTYTTILAESAHPLAVHWDQESIELAWVPLEEIPSYNLHPSFRRAWEEYFSSEA